jgi:agmatinase
VQLVGTEVVEVLPDRIGPRDITALVAERVVRETLTGVAVARALART